MTRSTRTAVYDGVLHLEACRLQGIAQAFPSHFHDHYVLGLIESGERRVQCGGQTCSAGKGALLIFHPGDIHACTQAGRDRLDYRGLNIPKDCMSRLAGELTGRRTLPAFSACVIGDPEAARCLRALHSGVMEGAPGREEALLRLLSLLLKRCGAAPQSRPPACREEVAAACALMEARCGERISLEQLCRHTGLSKSSLLRAFTQEKGTTPGRYLRSLRVGRAKALLEQGAAPAEAALQAGFSDQSHFTNCFTRYIGLPPGAYRAIFSASEGGYKHECAK